MQEERAPTFTIEHHMIYKLSSGFASVRIRSNKLLRKEEFLKTSFKVQILLAHGVPGGPAAQAVVVEPCADPAYHAAGKWGAVK